MKTKELKNLVSKIEEKKKIIAKERDELRNIHDNMIDLLESFDRGVEGLDNGILELINAIDTISEVV